MAMIQEIMQVGVGMPDRERFANFARDMLGLPATTSPDGRITYIRPDRYQHRIAARTAPEPVLNYIGLDVGGPDELAEWKTKLKAGGIDWRPGSREESLERHVADFIEFEDPDGHRLASRSTKSRCAIPAILTSWVWGTCCSRSRIPSGRMIFTPAYWASD